MIRPALNSANKGSAPRYAGPDAAGSVHDRATIAASEAGANHAVRRTTDRRSASQQANDAPTRISGSRAGVAQYAASGPATLAMVTAAADSRTVRPTTSDTIGQ